MLLRPVKVDIVESLPSFAESLLCVCHDSCQQLVQLSSAAILTLVPDAYSLIPKRSRRTVLYLYRSHWSDRGRADGVV